MSTCISLCTRASSSSHTHSIDNHSLGMHSIHNHLPVCCGRSLLEGRTLLRPIFVRGLRFRQMISALYAQLQHFGRTSLSQIEGIALRPGSTATILVWLTSRPTFTGAAAFYRCISEESSNPLPHVISTRHFHTSV